VSAIIRLHDVRKSYSDGETTHVVLDRASFEVNAGEVVALIGPSGSGKSTLLNLIGGIDAADSGTVEVAGNVLNGLDDRARTLFRRKHIGFVFQFFNLVPTLTVEENLLLPLELNAMPDGDRVLQLLEEVGMRDRAHRFPDQLSGGEQQRVAITRALIHRPSLLLADEPTGNLDVRLSAQVLELLLALAREHDRTMLIVTHSPEVAARADRVFVLGDRGIREQSRT